MDCHPKRQVPVMLSSPHEAAPCFHEDWTIVDGSSHDPVLWELEIQLREARNQLLREHFELGLAVFYTSKGTSMNPRVQSHDACTFHPIQAVSANGGISKFQNNASEVHEGDLVFCQAQRSNQKRMSCARCDVQIGYKQCRAMLCALIESANG